MLDSLLLRLHMEQRLSILVHFVVKFENLLLSQNFLRLFRIDSLVIQLYKSLTHDVQPLLQVLNC
jgi:hypothetical protein